MTIDEAIERELYRTEANREMADSFHTDENIYSKEEEAYRNRGDYHSQLAEWLRELKDIKHLVSITEKMFKANFRGGLIDVVDGYDILFSEHKQLREIFEEVNADE